MAIPGFDAISLERLALLRPVDPALAEQICQVANDADQHGKLKGKRLTDAVDASTPLAAPGNSPHNTPPGLNTYGIGNAVRVV